MVVVRFVKATGSFGVTVQLNEKTYGAIELCELTDDVVGNVAGMARERNVFLARVIDSDKKGRLQLSSRATVVDPAMWALISPDGSSGLFKNADFKRQSNGNLRNKILKYGSKLAISRGDLVLGYVTGISKAGCFVQVGHGTTVRVGLNELHDSPSYDFRSQVPIGRIVVCRITQTLDDNTRFNGSFRRSLVVYGVHQISKNDLKPDLVTTAFVLALADGAAFA